jgi:hypothetical protein
VRTPNVRIHVGNTSSHYRSYKRGHLPVRKNLYLRITQRDRQIARRLARYTGVPARKLVQLRRHGFHWFEIGRWLDLPRPVIRAARHHRSWKRFLREERRFARRHGDRYRDRHMAYSNEYEYDYEYNDD